MTLAAQPRGLHRPLAGGASGATVTVEPLLCGRALVPPAFLEVEPGPLKWLRYAGIGVPKSRWRDIPMPAFLIRHPSAGAILVDTGLHPSVATEPSQNLGRLVAAIGRIELKPEWVLARQLRDRGVDPKEVARVILTHLHFDHASGIAEFPNATFFLSEAEWQAASTVKRPILHGYRHQHFDLAFDYRAIDFRRGGMRSYSTFGRTFDLFADGSIRLAFTPGHTDGHVSVLCRLADRDLVIAGDAIYTMHQLDEDSAAPPRPEDRHEWRRSMLEIRRFREQHPDAIIIAGHDADQWPTLEARYE